MRTTRRSASGHRRSSRCQDITALARAQQADAGRDALHVVGHREQVERAQTRRAGSRPPARAEVAGERGRVAGDVGDDPRPRASTVTTCRPARCEAGRGRRRRAGGSRAGPRRRTRRGRPGLLERHPGRSAGSGGRPRRRAARSPRRAPRRAGRPLGQRRRRTAPPRSTGRAPAPPPRLEPPSSTASRSASAAPGCTCQKPAPVIRNVRARRRPRPAPPTRRGRAPARPVRAADGDDAGRERRHRRSGSTRSSTTSRSTSARAARPRPRPRACRARLRLDADGVHLRVGDPAVVDGTTSCDRCCAARPGRRSSTAYRTRVRQPSPSASPGTASTSTSSRSSPASRRSCSRTTSALSRRWPARSRAASRSRRSRPGRATGHGGSTRSGEAVEDLDRVGAPEPARRRASVIRTRTRSPGSACRTKTTRPSCRGDAVPAVGHGADPEPTSRPAPALDRVAGRGQDVVVGAGLGGRRGAGEPRRVGRSSRPPVRQPSDERQLPRHAGHHHARGEQQPALEPQRALVVQDLLPPVPDDVLGDVDGDDVARALAGGCCVT